MTLPDFHYYVHVTPMIGWSHKHLDAYYHVVIPDRAYTQMVSIGAFRGKYNWTNERLLHVQAEPDIDLSLDFSRRAGIEVPKKEDMQTFANLWSFYEFIGYDHKSKRYSTGEIIRKW
jgi:hypothetical protein